MKILVSILLVIGLIMLCKLSLRIHYRPEYRALSCCIQLLLTACILVCIPVFLHSNIQSISKIKEMKIKNEQKIENLEKIIEMDDVSDIENFMDNQDVQDIDMDNLLNAALNNVEIYKELNKLDF